MELGSHFLTWMKVEWPLPTIKAQPGGHEEKGDGPGVRGAAGGWAPFARTALYVGHIILPCQMSPVSSLEEVSVRCCAAVVGGQMDQHMARPLLFRCRVCCVTLNEAQVHTFKSFMGQYGNVYRLLLCPLYFMTSSLKRVRLPWRHTQFSSHSAFRWERQSVRYFISFNLC